MSRYQWPTGRKSKDKLRLRMEYNALTTGALNSASAALTEERRARRLDLLRAAPTADANLWIPIGPSAVISGMAGSRPRISGRVRDLAVSPEGNRAYAATANGGVWYTSDAGIAWSPLGNWIPTPTVPPIDRAAQVLACGCLLVSFGPPDGSGDDVYVGTGELVPSTDRGLPGGELGGVGVLHLDGTLANALADPFGNHWKREAKNLTGAGIFRLARDPGNPNTLVAATSKGLFTRSGTFVEDSDWSQVTVDPFNFNDASGKRITDVAWISTPGPRLWVALSGASGTDVYTSTAGLAGPFAPVNLPNVAQRSRLGIAIAPSDKTFVYVLGVGPHLWRISGVTPTEVLNLPNSLFTSASDQSDYDLAIAVHPDNPNIVVVGGATVKADNEWSASLYKFTITPAGLGFSAGFQAANQANESVDPTFIGNGVHADVHQIVFAKVGAAVHAWVGCDGGVFRSDNAANQYTFASRNTGLAVLEAGYVACHPSSAGFVIAGAQDNGALIRVGNTVWLHFVPGTGDFGDGGSVVIHPVKSRYIAAQYTNTDWNTNGTLSPPVLRSNTNSEQTEDGKAFFYNTADVRQVGATNQVRFALGSNRVWLADNWDPEAASTAWVTLPSNTDPRGVNPANDDQDTFADKSGKIVACRWVDDDRLLVLMRSRNKDGKASVVRLFTRAGNGTWSATEISKHTNKCSDFSNDDISQNSSDFLPPLGAWSDIAVHIAGPGQAVTCYVGCTGHLGADRMDTLWWYNGDGKWYPTGLATPLHSPPGSTVSKAPVYAVVVDPADTNTVYVGTAVGVFRGSLTFDPSTNPPTPIWHFQPFVNGLPEAAVQDLAFFNAGGVRLLRAAIQSRGVWEVDLSTSAAPTRLTFLRVHPTDARRAATTSLMNPLLPGPANWDWHASPDIRVRPAPLEGGEVVQPALTVTWNASSPDAYQLWVFQTALHKLDPRVRPNGLWSRQFASILRQRFGANRVTPADWTATVVAPNVFADPWDGTEPTEADLFELVRERGQDPNPTFGPPSISLVQPRKYKVDVLIHHRDVRPVAASDVKVTLLGRPLDPDQNTWPALPITADWKTKVVQLIGGASPAFADSWTVADATHPTRPAAGPLDARLPRGVTFDVNFTGAVPPARFLLLALVHSAPDPVNAGSLIGDTLQDLILKSHQVATRVVEIRP